MKKNNTHIYYLRMEGIYQAYGMGMLILYTNSFSGFSPERASKKSFAYSSSSGTLPTSNNLVKHSLAFLKSLYPVRGQISQIRWRIKAV